MVLVARITLFLSFCLLAGCAKTMEPINFNQVILPSSPNFALVAPPGFKPKPTIVAKPYDVSKQQLANIIVELIKQEPRIKTLSEDWERLEFSFIHRTLIFRFPDQIDIKFIEIEPGHSSLVMLSRSQYGHSDFGKNKKRMQQWLEDWDKALATPS